MKQAVQEKLQEERKSFLALMQRRSILAQQLIPFQDTINTVLALKPGSYFLTVGEQGVIDIPVKDMQDILPVLEILEHFMGSAFDQTHDTPTWRQFTCKDKPFFRVDASVKPDGENCRTVVVGYELVPKTEKKCGDEAKVADAPKPELTPAGHFSGGNPELNDDIPF